MRMDALTLDVGNGWESARGFQKRRVPTPALMEPADAEAVIVRARMAGVCGSDRNLWFRAAFREPVMRSLETEGKTTRTIGHELFGEVVAVGSAVEERYGVRLGDPVAAESHITCGRCFQCRLGELHVCTDEKILGISADGCFAEYVKLPAKVLWRVDPTRIRPAVACLLEPFGNAVHACTAADLRGKHVAVFGCGPIGLFTVAIARAFGAAQIVAIEPDPRRAALGTQFGADVVLPAAAPNPERSWTADAAVADELRRRTHGRGVDVALEMAGTNQSVNTALQSVRRGGTVILFGIKAGDFVLEQFERVIVRGLSLHAVIGRRIFQTWYQADALLSEERNGIQDAIWRLLLDEGAHVVPFASYEEATFERRLLACPKVVFQFA